ncbi:MAG: hypothetical protein GY742_02580, partial [Hyphomicrobiales bacterium]|nr:hypothetical protein [Hyphomicrobiales bacterium]
MGIDSSDWADETRQELILGFEEAIQSCMKGNGFDVYPVGLASGRDFQNLSEEELRIFENAPYVDADGRSLYDREFVEQYGYGFVAAAMHDLGLLAGGAIPADVEAAADLQSQMAIEMPEEEYIALLNTLGDSQSGCYSEARSRSAYGDIVSGIDSLERDFDEEIQDRVEADPRIVELENELVRCIAENGFAADRLVRERQSILDEVNNVVDVVDEPKLSDFMTVLDREIDLARVELIECSGGPHADAAWDEVRLEVVAELINANYA